MTNIFYNDAAQCNFVTVGPYQTKSSAEERLARVQRKIVSTAWIYGKQPEPSKEEGDVASEFESVIFSDSLDVNNMPTFDPTRESEIYSCKMEGCAAWVSDTLNQWQGNAWHAHRPRAPQRGWRSPARGGGARAGR